MQTITFKTDKNKVLLYIAQGTTANPLGINYNGKEYEKEGITESLCYTAEIGTDCQSAVLQIKNKRWISLEGGLDVDQLFCSVM